MEVEMERVKDEVRRTFEDEIKTREETLRNKLTSEKQKLLEEKQRVEDSLQKEMENRLGKRNEEFAEELRKEKEKLDKIIEQKELHQRLLEAQLNETKTENEKQKEQVFQVKEDLLNNFTELIETELQCSICNELFIQVNTGQVITW